MHYRDLIGGDNVVMVQPQGGYESGYHIFAKYLQAHLPTKTFHTLYSTPPYKMSGENKPFPYEQQPPYTPNLIPCKELSERGCTFVFNLPQYGCTKEMLAEFLLPFSDLVANSTCIGVVHDLSMTDLTIMRRYTDGPHADEEARLQWEVNMWLAENVLDAVVYPSMFLFNRYRDLGALNTNDRDVGSVVIPHPMDELLTQMDVKAPDSPGSYVMTSPLHKSNAVKLWAFVAALAEETYSSVQVVIPYPKGSSVNQEAYAEVCRLYNVRFEECDHARTLSLLKGALGFLDFTQYDEAFGFMVREACMLKTPTLYQKRGALEEFSDQYGTTHIVPGLQSWDTDTIRTLLQHLERLRK